LSLERFQLLRETIFFQLGYKVWGKRINFMTEWAGVWGGPYGVDGEFAALGFTHTEDSKHDKKCAENFD